MDREGLLSMVEGMVARIFKEARRACFQSLPLCHACMPRSPVRAPSPARPCRSHRWPAWMWRHPSSA